jgi:hypothetical protein
VRTQIWPAISTYLLVAILKTTKLEPSLHENLQVLSGTSFEKVPVAELLRGVLYILIQPTSQNEIPNSF